MIRWSEIYSTDTLLLSQKAEEWKVHNLALEDCYHRDQRPKLDDFGNHQLLVWFLLANGKIYEIQFLIFPNHLIAVPHDTPPTGQTWSEYLKISNNHKDVWHLLYNVLDRATDLTCQEMRILFEQIDNFEQEIFKKNFKPQDLLLVKKQLNQIDYSIGHLSSVAKQLQNLCKPTDDLNWKLRDLHDHCERIYQSLNLYRSQIGASIELFWGLQTNRTNKQIMKLSTVASVAVPLTFWSSFWGMNFDFIPYSEPVLFFVAIGLMLFSVVGTGWLLIKKGYLSE